MTLPRTQLLQFVAWPAIGAVIGVAGIWSVVALALDYPTRPVRIVEGFGAGGTPDLTSRLTGQWLSEHLGQPFVVENRPGAGSNIAAQTVVAATPDGYTLLTCLTANSINKSLYQKLDFVFTRDIAPVAGMIIFPMVLLVNPSFPVKSFPEFIAYAKANPGRINVASPGIGTPMHMSIELLKMTAGIDIVHVPYRGPTAALNDLIAGQIQAFVVTVPTALGCDPRREGAAFGGDEHDAGRRAAGYSKRRRSAVRLRCGELERHLCAEGDAPRHHRRPQHEYTAGFADPQIKAQIKDIDNETEANPGCRVRAANAGETSKWAKVIEFAGINVDLTWTIPKKDHVQIKRAQRRPAIGRRQRS